MRTLIYAVITSLVLVSCNQTNEVVQRQQPRIALTVTNLPALAEGEGHYQLWVTFLTFNKPTGGDSPTHTEGYVSLGEFNVVPGEGIRDLDGNAAHFQIPEDENVQLLDDVILTIQRKRTPQDTSEIEPGSVIIAGKFRGDISQAIADLTTEYADAFESNFIGLTGVYTITAPTSPSDSNSGIWFFEPNPTPAAGLKNLLVLPETWLYEGWAVDMTNLSGPLYYSTGKFARADSADLDGAGPGKGPGAGLNFPGQDFIVATGGSPAKPNLRGGGFKFLITLEPNPDNSPNPSLLTLLSSFPEPVQSGRLQTQSSPMFNVSSSFIPRGKVTVVR
ncbi:MAG: hypothetical protein HY708_02255 [Ignavibacteriae bacterium]|nr:hypothetical protein [Ignavibacteriota bacterium]